MPCLDFDIMIISGWCLNKLGELEEIEQMHSFENSKMSLKIGRAVGALNWGSTCRTLREDKEGEEGGWNEWNVKWKCTPWIMLTACSLSSRPAYVPCLYYLSHWLSKAVSRATESVLLATLLQIQTYRSTETSNLNITRDSIEELVLQQSLQKLLRWIQFGKDW